MLVCRAASVWPPPPEVTDVVCMRCQRAIPAHIIVAAIWIDKLNHDEKQHDWAAQLLCIEGKCILEAIPLPLMGWRH